MDSDSCYESLSEDEQIDDSIEDRLVEVLIRLMATYERLEDVAKVLEDREDAIKFREGYCICLEYLEKRYSIEVFVFKMLEVNLHKDLYSIKNNFPCHMRYLLNMCEKRLKDL